MKVQYIIFLCLGSALFTSCRKFINIDPPVNSITTEQVFADSVNTGSAISGVYALLSAQNDRSFSNGLITSYCGVYSDELEPYNKGSHGSSYYNTLSGLRDGLITWIKPYQIIYQINLIIENVKNNKAISSTTQKEMIAEVKFLRTLIYFYLVNLYGDVPYLTSSNWVETAKAPRSSVATIYQRLIEDLLEAQTTLRSDYSISSGQRIRANKWAATALLSRCYLYLEQWQGAEDEANKIISNSSLFKLSTDLNAVFTKNSNEAILQWNQNTQIRPYNATSEGIAFVATYDPTFSLTEYLLSSFEAGDQRKVSWVKDINYDGKTYQHPYKYKNGQLESQPNSSPIADEQYMVLRLAEQYLIRAEARAQQNKRLESIADINKIRNRAGLNNLPDNLTQTQILAAIAHERRIEFFAEWGHRWFDLKRTGKADEVMALVSPLKNGGIPWQPYKKLWPIPQTERNNNPFLTQNPGY